MSLYKILLYSLLRNQRAWIKSYMHNFIQGWTFLFLKWTNSTNRQIILNYQHEFVHWMLTFFFFKYTICTCVRALIQETESFQTDELFWIMSISLFMKCWKILFFMKIHQLHLCPCSYSSIRKLLNGYRSSIFYITCKNNKMLPNTRLYSKHAGISRHQQK